MAGGDVLTIGAAERLVVTTEVILGSVATGPAVSEAVIDSTVPDQARHFPVEVAFPVIEPADPAPDFRSPEDPHPARLRRGVRMPGWQADEKFPADASEADGDKALAHARGKRTTQ